MNLELIPNLFPFCDIKTFVKISMTNKKNNKIIYEIINNNLIKTKIIEEKDVEKFNLKKYNIMFISNFVRYMFDYYSYLFFKKNPNKTLKALAIQLTRKDIAIDNFYYIFFHSSNIFSQYITKDFDYYEKHIKFNHYAKYMKFVIEKDPLLFRLGTRGFRYHDHWGKKALEADIKNFRWVSRRLRNNEYYAKRAIEKNIQFFKYVGNILKKNIVFLQEVFYKNPKYWKNLLENNDKEANRFALFLNE